MRRGKLLGIAAVAIVAGSLVVVAPAHAGKGCGTPFEGFDITSALRAARQTQETDQGTRTVMVRLVNGRIFDESFAAISAGYRPGDLVWVDRSFDGGRTWSTCGPFDAPTSNEQSNLGNWMRACMATKLNGVAQGFCSKWYYDHS
jgi:hypothetical protein